MAPGVPARCLVLRLPATGRYPAHEPGKSGNLNTLIVSEMVEKSNDFTDEEIIIKKIVNNTTCLHLKSCVDVRRGGCLPSPSMSATGLKGGTRSIDQISHRPGFRGAATLSIDWEGQPTG